MKEFDEAAKARLTSIHEGISSSTDKETLKDCRIYKRIIIAAGIAVLGMTPPGAEISRRINKTLIRNAATLAANLTHEERDLINYQFQTHPDPFIRHLYSYNGIGELDHARSFPLYIPSVIYAQVDLLCNGCPEGEQKGILDQDKVSDSLRPKLGSADKRFT